MAKKPQKQEKLDRGEPQNFPEFADWALRELHDGLLMGGTKGMHAKLYMILPYYAKWLPRAKVTEGTK